MDQRCFHAYGLYIQAEAVREKMKKLLGPTPLAFLIK